MAAMRLGLDTRQRTMGLKVDLEEEEQRGREYSIEA
jgi:hypothetical protein